MTRTNLLFFFFSSRRRHTRCYRDWSSDVCSSDLLHDITALARLLSERVKDFHDPGQRNVLLLAVMLDAGPYSEQAESRLRARQALLEGLSESGFAPVDGEHIGFVTANWPLQNEYVQPPSL